MKHIVAVLAFTAAFLLVERGTVDVVRFVQERSNLRD